MIYLLDACALIAFLDEENGEGFEEVDALFENTGTGEAQIYISIINLTEVFYHFISSIGETAAAELMGDVAELPITVIRTITDEVYSEAARLKVRCSLSFADTFVCATAKSLDAVIVTKDGEIKRVEESENLSLRWIGPP
jgi:predicted nucleic acid-binding protein